MGFFLSSYSSRRKCPHEPIELNSDTALYGSSFSKENESIDRRFSEIMDHKTPITPFCLRFLENLSHVKGTANFML